MPLPANARVQLAASFVNDVREAGNFMRQQDPDSADERYERLLGRISEARDLLNWNPQAGRPARLVQARSIQGQRLAERAQAAVRAESLPTLRELILKPYVLLYAHAVNRVLLIKLKHERQRTFRP